MRIDNFLLKRMHGKWMETIRTIAGHIARKREAIGYYAFLCVLLAALGTAAYVYRNDSSDAERIQEAPGASVAVQSLPVKLKASPTPTPNAVPVNGAVTEEFCMDELIWSEELAQWQAHQAVDMAASQGAAVYAVMDGTVMDVYNDPLYGNAVLIDHGSGRLLKYCSLNTLQLVKPEQIVRRGEIIGSVGYCEAEKESGPHLHLEYIHNGIYEDPLPLFCTEGLQD